MAYEVICDLRYTWVLRNASDKLTWSNPGPGAKRGLNRLLGRDLKHSSRDYQEQSKQILTVLQQRLGNTMPSFEMREVEHGLCEYDKYCRALNSDGQMKRKYRGR
jgi:hypothetical protein